MFAGITVMISLLGLFVMGISFVRGLAVAGATGVLVMMIAAITLLPALLGMVGKRIDTTSRAAAASVTIFVVLALLGVFSGLAVRPGWASSWLRSSWGRASCPSAPACASRCRTAP